jgi:hypothetical protein
MKGAEFWRAIQHIRWITACALACIIAGCGTTPPATVQAPERPKGNLGAAFNSPADDFAPMIIDTASPAGLAFTTDRVKSNERVRRLALDRPSFTRDSSLPLLLRIDESATRPFHQGTVAFLRTGEAIFASSHAPDSMFATRFGGFGGIRGGSDLFSNRVVGRDTVISTLGDQINSIWWDAQPTVGERGDSLLLIFASDRPDDHGYSQPFDSARYLKHGDTVRGNTDLYYAFRIAGKWSAAHNLADATNKNEVNTPFHEYSPFLDCIECNPTLFFASNRSGDLDIYSAHLDVNFKKETIAVGTVSMLPKGADTINSASDDAFPCVVRKDSTAWLVFASTRDSAARQTNGKTVQAFGGYDLYRFGIAAPCAVPLPPPPPPMPKLTYRVLVLDHSNSQRPVTQSTIRIAEVTTKADSSLTIRNRPFVKEIYSNHYTVDLPLNKRYRVEGWSMIDTVGCAIDSLLVTSYSPVTISRRDTAVARDSSGIRDTIIGGRRKTLTDTIRLTDTVRGDRQYVPPPNSTVASMQPSPNGIIVRRLVLKQRDTVVGGRHDSVRFRMRVTNTAHLYDTTTTTLAQGHSVSMLTSFGGISTLGIRKDSAQRGTTKPDSIIVDTIYLRPNHVEPMQCGSADTGVQAYFQTGFWEVNTSENLKRFLEILDGKSLYRKAKFIELHKESSYWKGGGHAYRPDRLRDLQQKARIVDSNLACFARLVTDTLLPRFEKRKRSDEVLLITMVAQSDRKPIAEGKFWSQDTVQYVGASYEAASGAIHDSLVVIRPGCELVSKDNDTLSSLRAYFGYRELLARIQASETFTKLVRDHQVLLPDNCRTTEEYDKLKATAKVIFLTKGEFVGSIPITTKGWISLKRHDPDRTIIMEVMIRKRVGGYLVKPDCCK